VLTFASEARTTEATRVMYRVMSLPPGPDGHYGRGPESGPYELVFQVPRLEAYVQECAHYTVVLPQYVAEEMREGEARKDIENREHMGTVPRDIL